MNIKICTIIFILSASSIPRSYAQIGMGPINLKIIKGSQCPSDYNGLDIKVEDSSKNIITVTVDATEFEIDDSISYKVQLDKIQNGQIQKGVFKKDGNAFCKEMVQFLGDLWTKLQEGLGMKKECPKPAGKYVAKNYHMDFKDLAIKTFLYGRFIVHAEIFKAKKKIACVDLEVTNNRPGESV